MYKALLFFRRLQDLSQEVDNRPPRNFRRMSVYNAIFYLGLPDGHPSKNKIISNIGGILIVQGLNPDDFSIDDLVRLANNENGFTFKDLLAEGN